MNFQSLAGEIIQMKEHDLEVRQGLAESGALYDGYHAEMEAVHLKHARRLSKIIDEIGWPSEARVGRQARDAAMIIVLHAISFPGFQRRCLEYVKRAMDEGLEDRRNFAFLYDRICFNERRPQVFGTQYDWDEHGEMSPWVMEDTANVNALRLSYGLNPIEEETEAIRKGVADSNQAPPESYELRQKEMEEWSRKVGWIT
ncbi:MAG: hypothetical protein KDD36_10590 [Flavobacteriales bacterium]|nr:hypothetical protein [Flavobacteriales bacterium]